ncbi:MAG: DUF3365 domain-containing protein [Syntrophobacterales bacterium]|nr:DUF3365 domain-containing protein [Syntrophobacterales bacterium]
MIKFKNLRLMQIVAIGIGIIFLIGASAIILMVQRTMKEESLHEAESKARLLLDRNLATHMYFSQNLKPRLFEYTAPFSSKDYFEPSWMSSTYANREINKYFQSLNPFGYYIKDAASDARNPENEADAYELDFLAKMKKDKKLNAHSDVQIIAGKPYLVVLKRGEVIEGACLRCHGEPGAAPAGMLRLYGVDKAFHRKLDDLVSIISIRIPLAEAYKGASNLSLKLSIMLVAVLAIVLAVLFVLYRHFVVAPIGAISAKARELSGMEGRLGETIPQQGSRELNELCAAFNELSQKLRIDRDGLEKRVQERTRELETANEQLAREIVEHKLATEALTKSEDKFRRAFYISPDAVNINRLADGMYVSINAGFTKIMGYTKEDIIGKTSIEYDIWDNIEDRQRLVAGLRKNGEATNLEAAFRTKDGKLRYGLMSASVLTLDGAPHILSITRDITERKQAEAEKKLLEEKLQHADKMEAIGTLAGGIAHDFNNLLMGIQGYASLLLMHIDSSHPHYEKLKRIEEQVGRGADLAKQLLGFARGGRYEIKPTDMNDLLEKSSSLFGRTKKEISISRKYEENLLPVEVDRGQMEQVFLNLYVNAWQAMPGGGELYIETGNVFFDDAQAAISAVTPGKYVKITIADTGIGMDEKIRARIFEPFFTTKAMGRGTGLGLAMVYGIIKGHKGAITVDSKPGQGTTFTIYLPASEQEAAKEKAAIKTIARGTETILLVDDEQMILKVNRELLEFLGYRVYAAGSGQEALAVYMEKQKEIDLVILDMILPGISGGETFDRLRGFNPALKVLLASGYSIKGEAQAIMERGCNGFIQKPFRLEILSRKIREMLD